ncbi:hypothetical protein B566_EDAN012268 [Ephemera danica]|nr:hypothetical protein B566_EDAN012268 [Ephemera danica]
MLQKLEVTIENPQAVINEGFYEFAQERGSSQQSGHLSSEESQTLLGIASIIPKAFRLRVEDCTLTGMHEHSRPDFQALLHTVSVNSTFKSTQHTVPFDLMFCVNLEDFNVKCGHISMLKLMKLSLDAKVTDGDAAIDVLLDTLAVTYTHRDIYNWVFTNFKKQTLVGQRTVSPESSSRRPSWLQELLLSCQTNVQLWSVAVALQLSDQHQAGFGFRHTKITLDSIPTDALASSHPWGGELLVEDLWCRLGAPSLSFPDAQAKRQHLWGTPIYLGMLLLKLQGPSSVRAMLDSVRFEWSSRLARCFEQGVKCLKDYAALFISKTSQPANVSERRELWNKWSATVTLSHFNVFLIAYENVCIMLRLDMARAERSPNKVSVTCEGTKVVTMCPVETYYNCIKCDEVKGGCAYVKLLKLKRSSSEMTIHLSEEVHASWNTNLHLKMLHLSKEIAAFVSTFKRDRVPISETPAKAVLKTSLRMKGVISLAITISSHHYMNISLEDLSVEMAATLSTINSHKAKIAIDGSDIFLIEGLHVARVENSEEIRLERANSEGFLLPWNNTWGVTILNFCVKFPYEHNFAEAFQNEFVSLYKWLKMVHKRKRQPFTADSPLPPDLLIKVHEFVFEMSDDPFEVRLRDNFELLEDEYQESLKRQKMLDAKVEELQKTLLLLPAGKIEELYSGLSKKNAETYIQRSKQMSAAGPSRTRLFAWSMQEVEILALADPSVHGTERAVAVMQEIDADSPWPERGLEFTTLWCRAVRTSFKEWKFLLRDFPQPLLHIRNMLVTCVVELGEPWGDEIIERSMTSLKFYHDFSCDVEHFSYAFGPCWEPVIAQCNLSFEKISSPSRDPSPTLPFWDKMRLLYHGRLTMSIQQLTVLLHASLDPYNTTEEMELTWSDVVMDWTTAKFVFKGDLNVYVRTASKYDDCRLLHLPNLKLTIKLNWVCLSDPNDHHAANAANYDFPVALLYGSTLRWFESLKLILSGVTRPTRRGPQFRNVRPRKLQLSRHYRRIHLLLGLHRFQVCYWMSFAMQRGFELIGGRVSSSSEHILNLVPVGDGLKHRPRAEWSIGYMNCELNDAEIWLQTALQEDPSKEHVSMRQPVEKCYFLSVAKVSYGRETSVNQQEVKSQDNPHHRLVVYDLKGAWTKSNRDVAFALFDSFVKAKQLKKNLSTEALKGFRGDSTSTPLKRPVESTLITSPSSALQQQQATHSPMTKLQSGHAATMLQQLIAEAENKAIVFSDDLSTQTREQLLQGLAACHEDDVLFENWHIVLVNSQVLLKGCETKGYVIMSAAKAQILQRIHRPVWKQHTLVSKSTWVGSLECMQYYATEKDSTVIAELPDVPHIVGSGQSVGGVCEFFYAGYGEDSMDPGSLDRVLPPPTDDPSGPWEQKEQGVDAFTLMHYDLDVCTNSLQYAMILDIVNNLMLHVEPRRKEASERLQRMRFQLQLRSFQDQRKPIQQLQNQVRMLSKSSHLQVFECKELLTSQSDELNMIISCFKETQITTSQKMATMKGDKSLATVRANEICFKHAQWRLTEADGQLGIADLYLSICSHDILTIKILEIPMDRVCVFRSYTKNSRSDDSVEHLLELGYVRMTNLLPNQVYTEVLCPTEIQSNMPRAVRVFCREKAPVGGISVKEHFEINVVPLTISLTKQFYNTMLKFCFPERDPNSIDGDDEVEADGKVRSSKSSKPKKGKEASFYVRIERKDDVEKMKERAEKNKLFIYIKIPEVPVKVSYKGSKEKNLEDIRDFSLTIPTLEYHNVTWTWLDLLLAMKSDSRKVIVSQAIKQKLQIKTTRSTTEERASPQEEDKARMLLGARLLETAVVKEA